MANRDNGVIDLGDDPSAYTVEELCQGCGIEVGYIVELVESGVLEPTGRSPGEWRFTAHTVVRARKAVRLQRDLGINPAGLALSLDLLEDLEALRNEVRTLRQLLSRLHPSG